MERKIKVIKIYVGLLFFVSILTILITSLSNSKFDPAYSAEQGMMINSPGLNSTVEDSVSSITETNKNLSNKISEYESKVSELEKQLEEKNTSLKEYETKYNENTIKFYSALKFYVQGNKTETMKIFETINRELLSEDDKSVYDELIKELN